MKRRLEFTWNSAWFHPGASLWSIAAKVAFLGDATVGAVLQLLLESNSTSRCRLWAADATLRETIAGQFDLARRDVEAMFFDIDSENLEQRQHLSSSLRWCPKCIEQRYHCTAFQDRRRRCCPWHDVRLLDSCPHCAYPVDPFARPWHCGRCKSALVVEPENWLADFKLHPVHDGVLSPVIPPAQLAYEEHTHAVVCMPDSEGESLLEWHPDGLGRWQQGQLFESAAALWDTVLSDHRACGEDELFGDYGTYSRQEFKCPVAAAARAVFMPLGVEDALQGRWNTFRISSRVYDLIPRPGTVSLEVRRALLRELPRAWLADALLLLGQAVRAERSKVVWKPDVDAFSPKTTSDMGLETVTKRPTDWLDAAVDFAACGCVKAEFRKRSTSGLRLLLD